MNDSKDTITKVPVDSAGTLRHDWIGGGKWKDSSGKSVDFDAGTYTNWNGEVYVMSAYWHPDDMLLKGYLRMGDPKIPVDSTGTMRHDWVGGGRWETSSGDYVDFDAGTFTHLGELVEPLSDVCRPDKAKSYGWVRADKPAPAPETPPIECYTDSDRHSPAFDARAYAARLEVERREFDRKIACYQTPWPQSEIDAAHERGRLARVAEEIARMANPAVTREVVDQAADELDEDRSIEELEVSTHCSIYWNDQDPRLVGWAYICETRAHHTRTVDSGALNCTDPDAKYEYLLRDPCLPKADTYGMSDGRIQHG